MGRNLHYGQANRRGFTLIELLVVIGIITVLITLTAAATIRFIGTQYQHNTEATIYKVHGELSRQWQEVIKKAKLEDPCLTAQQLGANADPALAKVIHVKLRLKQEFPMNYYEVFYPALTVAATPLPDPTLPPIQEYVDALAAVGITSASPQAQQTWIPTQDENSACLVMALRRNRGGKGTNADDLLGPGVVGTNQLGLKIINDAWEQPIVFYRWATANTELDNSGPGPNTVPAVIKEHRDLEDADGRLQDFNWWFSSGLRGPFESRCHSIHSLANINVQYAYFMTPVIASGGADQKLGIAPDKNVAKSPQDEAGKPNPMTIVIAADANDNIYSFRQRLGGRGD